MAYNPISGSSSSDKKSSKKSGGGGSYNPVGASSGSSSKSDAPKKKKHKEKHHHGLLGLTENLVHDVGDAVQGAPGALWQATKSVMHDIDTFSGINDDTESKLKYLGVKDPSKVKGLDTKNRYELDDLGKATLDAMKYQYEPLAHGDVKTFGQRTYEHPLGPVLDAFTIATLGAGGAVRGAKILGDVGEANSGLARLTGGIVRDVPEGEDGALTVARSGLGRARGQKHGAMLSRDGQRILEPAPRLIMSRAQKAAEGHVSALSSEAKHLRSEGDGLVKVGEYSQNPIRRLQERAYDAISEATGLSDARIAHEGRKIDRNAAHRRDGLSGANVAAKVLRSKEVRNLDPETKRAFANQSVVGHTDDIRGVAAANMAQMTDDLDRVINHEHERHEHRVVKSVVGSRKGDKATGAAAHALGRTTTKLKEAEGIRDHLDANDLGIDEYNKMIDQLDGERAMTHGDPEVEQVDLNELLGRAVTPNHEGKLVPVIEAATDHQIVRAKHLKDDIHEFGFDNAIDISKGKDGRLIVNDGVSRLLAAAEMGRDAVPVRLSKTFLTHGKHGADVRSTGSRFSRPSEHGLTVHDRHAASYKKHEDAREVVEKKILSLQERKRILANAVTHGVDHFVKDREQILKVADSPEQMMMMQATMKVQQHLAEKGLDASKMKVLNQLMEVLRPVVEGQGGNDELLASTAATRGAKGPRSKAERGIEPEGFAISRTSNRDANDRAHRQSGANRSNPSRMRQPDSSKMSEGYNERFGLDAADPRNVIATHEAVNRFRQSLDSWGRAVDAMQPMSDILGPLPKGYSEVPAGAATKFLRDARAFLDDEAPVIYGEDHPTVAQAREIIVEGFGGKFAKGPLMVPTKLLRVIEREMKPQGRLPLLDNVTGLWRASVVSPLRPAFVTNNIIGQTALLAVAHGAYGTLRGILHYAQHGKELEKYMGAVVGSGQAATLMRETSRMLDNGGKVTGGFKKANEVMGRVSQAITDDPFRRIAFAKEVMPTARKLVKQAEKSGKTVSEDGVTRPYMMRDALHDLLDDEATMDRVERKVLDDLVDFDDLNRAERMIVRRILPFYGWIKGSGKMTIKLIQDNPAFVDLLYHGSQVSNQITAHDAGGQLPDYMMGLLDLNDIHGGKDKLAITTAQFNPFVTPGDTLAQVGFPFGVGRRKDQSAFNPDNPLSQTTPLVKAGLSALTGKDAFSGRDMTPAQVMATSFPLVNSYGLPHGWLGLKGQANQRDGIYGRSRTNELLKYLGAPIRQDVNVDKAIALEEDPFRSFTVSGHQGSQFVIGPDGKLYMDIGKPKGDGKKSKKKKERNPVGN